MELRPMAGREVLDRLLAMPVPMVVVSGGEPLNQQRRLLPLLRRLRERGIEIEVETNGTVAPLPALVGLDIRFNVSPKLAHSGDPAVRRISPEALAAFRELPGALFKFVCADLADLDEVSSIVEAYRLHPVWIMPRGTSAEAVMAGLRMLAGPVVSRGWNLSTRLHVLAWGDKRGV